MKDRTAKTAGRIAQSPHPTSLTSRHTALLSSAIILGICVSLSCGWLLSSTRAVEAGLTDWLSPTAAQTPKTKKPVKKAGIRQPTKKPTTATGRMLDSVASAPRKMVSSSMSALLPGKKPTTSKGRTVPRKLVAEQSKPSMLQRMFTAPEKDKPLTVTEWMAQPRPKP